MKSLLTVLKITLLVVFLVVVTFGYLFFRVWQKNERPEVTSSSWSESEILLGYASVLEIEVEAPWHREVMPLPQSYPESLVPVLEKAKFNKGNLSPLGMREWTIRVPFVATDTKDLDGASASFPLKKTKRISPTTVNLTLPPLSVITPADIPEKPRVPGIFLTEERPKEPKIDEANSADKKADLWIWSLGLLVLIPLVIYLLKRTGIIKTTPPWEKALGNLARLDPNSSSVAFYSKLTDILKQYASERYSFRGRSKTSAEFLGILKDHPLVPDEHLGQLELFAHLSDEVKFADFTPDSTEAPKSLELIKKFVNDTTPEVDESKKDK